MTVIFSPIIRIGTVLRVPSTELGVNQVEVEFEDNANRYWVKDPNDVEWINPRVFPEIPKVGDKIRFTIEPTIVKTEVL